MKAKTPKEVLIAARYIIDTVGFCKKATARDRQGNVTSCNEGNLSNIDAVCISGALQLVNTGCYERGIAINILADICSANYHRDFISFNDHRDITKEEVLKVFDLAIEEANSHDQ
jgi:hypothetical protein